MISPKAARFPRRGFFGESLAMELQLAERDYSCRLDTQAFARMLGDPTQCYKFYWLDALIVLAAEKGGGPIAFGEAIDEMIAAAWGSVVRCHLRLGPRTASERNLLEAAVLKLAGAAGLAPSASRAEVRQAAREHRAAIRAERTALAKYVPYRLLAPFLALSGNDPLWDSKARLIAFIARKNAQKALPYTIEDGRGLEKSVTFGPDWARLIADNFAVIRGWIQFKKAEYLQARNPGVPGILAKIDPDSGAVRRLDNARALWRTASEAEERPLIDIYSGAPIEGAFALDHFVPWSYVACDELWNLTPAEASVNSSKSDRLPDWGRFFGALAAEQYFLYGAVQRSEAVRRAFEKCRRDNLNDESAAAALTAEGLSEKAFRSALADHLHPVWETARLQGYPVWTPD
jgi:hypothetical protein